MKVIYKGIVFIVVFVLVTTLVSTQVFNDPLSPKMLVRSGISGLLVFALMELFNAKKPAN